MEDRSLFLKYNYRNNYDKIENLYRMNIENSLYSDLDCSRYPMDRICNGVCISNNFLVAGNFSYTAPSYCKWYIALYDSMFELVVCFNNKQNNPLFKDYFMVCDER